MIAFRYWSKAVPVFYVANLPGDGGVDWGYTTDYAKALELTPYWQKRFAKMCREVGTGARFVTTASEVTE